MKVHYKSTLMAASILSASFVPCAALAQSAQPAESGFGDIIVTAQRREEALSKVPVAVTALSSETLSRQAITTDNDLQASVPGLTVRSTFNSNQLNYSIRGQTIDPFTTSQPGVLPYFNDFQITQGYGSVSLYDLQSVQVLKGPQGTLFGRNATGGAVLFTSARPTDELEGYVRASYGSQNSGAVEGALNLPVSERVALRLAGRATRDGGFARNLVTGTKLGKIKGLGLRGSLRTDFSDTVTNTLVIDYSRRKGTGSPSRIYSYYPPASGAAVDAGALYNSGTFNFLFGPGAWDTYAAAKNLPAGINGLGDYYDLVKNNNPNADVYLDTDPRFHSKATVAVNTTTMEVSPTVKLKNIFGYSHANSGTDADADGTPFVIQSAFTGSKNKSFSNELQLSGNVLDDKLDFVTGIYYYQSRARWSQGSIFVGFQPLAPDGADFETVTILKNKTLGIYAQGTYDLGSGFGFGLGGRYTKEKVSLRQHPDSRGAFYQFFGEAPEQTKVSKFNWQALIQKQFNPDLMAYAKVSTSFRSGGFNIGSAPIPGTVAVGGNEFLPEKTISYEIGLKANTRLGTMPFRVNFAAFRQEVKNIQRVIYAVPPGGQLSGYTVNVPEAVYKGFEIDGALRLTEGLELGGALSVLDGEFTKPTAIVFGLPKTYGPVPDSPKFSGSGYIEAWHELSGVGTLRFRGDLYHQSTSYFSSLNGSDLPGTNLKPYTTVNFRVAMEDIADTKLSLAFHMKNAFDAKYYTGGTPTGEVFAINTAVPGAPRTWFVEVAYKF